MVTGVGDERERESSKGVLRNAPVAVGFISDLCLTSSLCFLDPLCVTGCVVVSNFLLFFSFDSFFILPLADRARAYFLYHSRLFTSSQRVAFRTNCSRCNLVRPLLHSSLYFSPRAMNSRFYACHSEHRAYRAFISLGMSYLRGRGRYFRLIFFLFSSSSFLRFYFCMISSLELKPTRIIICIL